MRDWRLNLKDVLTAMERTESFVAGMDVDAFCRHDKRSCTVIRKFEIIGEAEK